MGITWAVVTVRQFCCHRCLHVTEPHTSNITIKLARCHYQSFTHLPATSITIPVSWYQYSLFHPPTHTTTSQLLPTYSNRCLHLELILNDIQNAIHIWKQTILTYFSFRLQIDPKHYEIPCILKWIEENRKFHNDTKRWHISRSNCKLIQNIKKSYVFWNGSNKIEISKGHIILTYVSVMLQTDPKH